MWVKKINHINKVSHVRTNYRPTIKLDLSIFNSKKSLEAKTLFLERTFVTSVIFKKMLFAHDALKAGRLRPSAVPGRKRLRMTPSFVDGQLAGHHPSAIRRDKDVVLDSDSAPAGEINPGLYRHDHIFHE